MKKILSLLLVVVMLLSLTACDIDVPGTIKPQTPTNASKHDHDPTKPQNPTATPTDAPTTPPAEETTPEPPADEKDKADDNTIDPDFKAAMDSYEKFFDKYVEILKKYQENPTDLSILMDYFEYMGQYAETMQKFEEWENEDLNVAETAYYIEVQARISRKLLEIA